MPEVTSERLIAGTATLDLKSGARPSVSRWVETAQPARPGAAGLTSAAAAVRLRTDGPNAIEERGQRSTLAILVGQFASPLVHDRRGGGGLALPCLVVINLAIVEAVEGFVYRAGRV